MGDSLRLVMVSFLCGALTSQECWKEASPPDSKIGICLASVSP